MPSHDHRTLSIVRSVFVRSMFVRSMFVRSLWKAAIAPLLVGLLLPSAAPAQPPAMANEITSFKGTLKGFKRGVLTVTREDGTDVMVQLPQDAAAFVFNASAKPQFLQRGMMVRFQGSFAPNGNPTAPVMKVEIFQPVNPQAIRGHTRELFTPGVHPVDRHGGKKPTKVAKYNIVGSLMGINNAGGMMVQAGKIPVSAQLDATATFQVRYNNLNLAKEGDPVSVEGFYTPPDDTKIRGDRITVTTDRVYGEYTEPEVPKRRGRRTTKDAKSNDANAADKIDSKGKINSKEMNSGEDAAAKASAEDIDAEDKDAEDKDPEAS